MPGTAAVVQMAINPKMPRINHPMNFLDHWSNLVSNQQANPAMGLFPGLLETYWQPQTTSRSKNQKGFVF